MVPLCAFPRLFGGKPSKQAPVTTAENMKNSTVISNPHATFNHVTTVMESPDGGVGGVDSETGSPLCGGRVHGAGMGTLGSEQVREASVSAAFWTGFCGGNGCSLVEAHRQLQLSTGCSLKEVYRLSTSLSASGSGAMTRDPALTSASGKTMVSASCRLGSGSDQHSFVPL